MSGLNNTNLLPYSCRDKKVWKTRVCRTAFLIEALGRIRSLPLSNVSRLSVFFDPFPHPHDQYFNVFKSFSLLPLPHPGHHLFCLSLSLLCPIILTPCYRDLYLGFYLTNLDNQSRIISSSQDHLLRHNCKINFAMYVAVHMIYLSGLLLTSRYRVICATSP